MWGRRSPRVQEQGQPQAIELVGDLRVEEGQEAADFIQAVHLEGQGGLGGAASSAPSPAPKDVLPGREGTPEDGGHPYSLGAGEGAPQHLQCPRNWFPAREVPLQGHCCNFLQPRVSSYAGPAPPSLTPIPRAPSPPLAPLTCEQSVASSWK